MGAFVVMFDRAFFLKFKKGPKGPLKIIRKNGQLFKKGPKGPLKIIRKNGRFFIGIFLKVKAEA